MEPLRMFTVYRNPSDFPGKFVVRRWHCTNPPTADPAAWSVSDSLDDARETIPAGLVPMSRHDKDDACIVEVWF